LLASLSADLKKKIENKSGRTDPFVDVLFVFIEYKRPVSVDASQAMVDTVRVMTPGQFPVENITLFVETIQPKLEHLEIGRLWDSMNNPALCRTLALAGGGNNSKYNSELYSLHNKLHDECKSITHLANQEKVLHMASKSLGWENILDVAESRYLAQVVTGRIRWPPACHATNSKAPPPTFGTENLSLTQLDHRGGNSGENRGNGGYNNNSGS